MTTPIILQPVNHCVPNVEARRAELARAEAKWQPGDEVDYVYKIAGASEHRVPCKVLGVTGGVFGTLYRVRLSQKIFGMGEKLEVLVCADRLARPRARTKS